MTPMTLDGTSRSRRWTLTTRRAPGMGCRHPPETARTELCNLMAGDIRPDIGQVLPFWVGVEHERPVVDDVTLFRPEQLPRIPHAQTLDFGPISVSAGQRPCTACGR